MYLVRVLMALPMNDGTSPYDESAGRDTTVDGYRITCMEFIKDISKDYLAWVDRYKLPPDEDQKRRTGISSTVERTNEWIAKVAQSIKAIDVVMNDGIQKMAEATAGKPFQIGVFVNQKSSYTMTKPGIIDVNVKATSRNGRKTTLGFHFKDDRFRIESTAKEVHFDETNLPLEEFDFMDIHLKLYAEKCQQRDVISFTVTVYEMENRMETDKRGVSTIIHIV